MKALALILLLSLSVSGISQEFRGKPTTEGINTYIKTYEYQFIDDYQNYVGDTLNDVYIETDNLSTYYNHLGLELGYFYYPNEIIITNEELFLEYRLENLSKFQKNQYRETNQFVYAVVMHELTHFYFYQLIAEARSMGMKVDAAYLSGLRMFPHSEYGAEFIEEGLCEYIPVLMGEIIPYEKYTPSRKEIVDCKYDYSIKYRYSSQYVSTVVDSLGFKAAVFLLIRNQPPSQGEICDRDKFINRLK